MSFFPIEHVYWLLDFNFCLTEQTAFRIIRCIIHRCYFQKWFYSNPRSPRLTLNWIATLFGNFDRFKNRTYKTYIIISRVPLVAIFAFISTDDSKSWVDVNLCFRPGSDAVLHLSRIECKWAKSFVLPHLHSIRLMWSMASELGLWRPHPLAQLNIVHTWYIYSD